MAENLIWQGSSVKLTVEMREYYKDRFEASRIIAHDGLRQLFKNRLTLHVGTYGEVASRLDSGIPWQLIAAIHSLESNCNFSTHLANGDPLSARTIHVPAGLPRHGEPPFDWVDMAVLALRMHGADKIEFWDIAQCLHFAEGYNGWGYMRGRGQETTPRRTSPYLWAGTDQYERGKYVEDGEFDPLAVSKQIGVVAILKGLGVG